MLLLNRNDTGITTKLRTAFGLSLPPLLLIIAFIAMVLPWQMPHFSSVKPNLPIIVIFFWTYIRTESIPTISLFLCTLLTDIMMPTPIGYHTLMYFLTIAFMLWRSLQFTTTTLTLFYGEFIVVSGIFYALSWFMSQIAAGQFHFDINIAFAWGFTLLAFGIMFPILRWSYQFYPLGSPFKKQVE